MFWRYFAGMLPQAEVAIFRDTDSILSLREATSVASWLDSGKSLHVIRDHPWHTMPIMGGMWGLRGKENLRSLYLVSRSYADRAAAYGDDQLVLAKAVYPRFRRSLMVSASFNRYELFSSCRLQPRESSSFIGERVFGDQGPEQDLANRETLRLHEKTHWRKLLLFWVSFKERMWSLWSFFRALIGKYPDKWTLV